MNNINFVNTYQEFMYWAEIIGYTGLLWIFACILFSIGTNFIRHFK